MNASFFWLQQLMGPICFQSLLVLLITARKKCSPKVKTAPYCSPSVCTLFSSFSSSTGGRLEGGPLASWVECYPAEQTSVNSQLLPFCPSIWKSSLHCPCIALCIDAGEASFGLLSFMAKIVLLAWSFVLIFLLHHLAVLKPRAL